MDVDGGGGALPGSEQLVPLTDLKINAGRVVRHAEESHRPVLLTRRGRGIAVLQSVADYAAAEEVDERAPVTICHGNQAAEGRRGSDPLQQC